MAKSVSKMKPAAKLAEIARIIEAADARALSHDGATGHVRDELTDAEWRRIYQLAKPRVMPQPKRTK